MYRAKRALLRHVLTSLYLHTCPCSSVVYEKKGVQVIVRIEGQGAASLPGMQYSTCIQPVCSILYVKVTDPTDWYGGCDNNSINNSDLTPVDGVCVVAADDRATPYDYFDGGLLTSITGRTVAVQREYRCLGKCRGVGVRGKLN